MFFYFLFQWILDPIGVDRDRKTKYNDFTAVDSQPFVRIEHTIVIPSPSFLFVFLSLNYFLVKIRKKN